MLTVKWIQDGQETLVECSAVHYMPEIQNENCYEPEKVQCYRGDLVCDEIEEGRVYVMNDQGRTIASYNLPEVTGEIIKEITSKRGGGKK